jgi:hypothetical protein
MMSPKPKGISVRTKARAVKMQEQGAALSRQADYINVCSVLRLRSDLVADLKAKFIDLDLMHNDGSLNDLKLPSHPKEEQDFYL